ncbi:MAG TPA: hypothetical protein VJT82_07865, partial [Pyrinomonadaceae bacterium]|nr:hypothetical protein [Pyrinomonadaceae bacterium]
LLSPMFTYAYAREVGRSRTAALLAGLSYGYGGAMTGLLGVVGLMTNALVWLPLMLIAVDRARTRRFTTCLAGAGAAYALSVLTGLAQGFVFVALVAGSYALFLALAGVRSDGGEIATSRAWSSWERWRPVAVAVGGVALGASVGAFQILETMRVVRRSIRRTLIYPFFVGGSFAPRVALKSLAAPLYTERFADVGTYVAPLVLLLAVIAVISAVRNTRRENARRDPRILFWAATALVACVLILGKYTPVYGLLYHVPVVNSFRVPSRFAFVWTFAASILAAYGWDALERVFLKRATNENANSEKSNFLSQRLNILAVSFLTLLTCDIGLTWWRATHGAARSGLDAATGVPRAWAEGFWYTGLPVASYLAWKLVFTGLIILLVWRALKIADADVRRPTLLIAVALVCFVEPHVVVSNWWKPFAKTPSRFVAASPVTRFLQAHAAPRERVYTRVNLFAEEFTDAPRFDPPNLTALYGLENVGGYEPLMLERYSRALGNVHLDAASPIPGFAPNRQLFDARSRVLDLLGARFVVNAEMPLASAPPVEMEGVRFAPDDLLTELKPGQNIFLTAGGAVACDTLALVTSMSNSVGVADGATVGLVRLHTTDGRVVERALRAGADTSEWAHERADVRASVRHALAPVFDSVTVEDERGGYPSHRYWTRVALGSSVAVERVEIVNATESVPLAVWKATLYDAATRQSQTLRRTQKDLYAGLDANRWRAVYDADDVLVLENKRALPRAWLVAEAEAVDGEEALKRIGGEGARDFDPRRTALLEDAPAEMPALPGGEPAADATATVASYEPNRIVIETKSDKPVVLVVGEIFYPGWEATVDGVPARIHLTDFILRGLPLPAGAHRVEMRYVAPAARNGAIISVLSLLVLGSMSLYSRRRKSLS